LLVLIESARHRDFEKVGVERPLSVPSIALEIA
jgi:hypothetical protein